MRSPDCTPAAIGPPSRRAGPASTRLQLPPLRASRCWWPIAQARHAELAVFVRTPAGWQQTSSYQPLSDERGLHLTVDAAGAAEDGAENLMVAALDPPLHKGSPVRRHGTARPAGVFEFERSDSAEGASAPPVSDGGRGTALPAPLCGSRWRISPPAAPGTGSLHTIPGGRPLTFGDGNHGAIPAPGFGSILVAEMVPLPLRGRKTFPPELA